MSEKKGEVGDSAAAAEELGRMAAAGGDTVMFSETGTGKMETAVAAVMGTEPAGAGICAPPFTIMLLLSADTGETFLSTPAPIGTKQVGVLEVSGAEFLNAMARDQKELVVEGTLDTDCALKLATAASKATLEGYGSGTSSRTLPACNDTGTDLDRWADGRKDSAGRAAKLEEAKGEVEAEGERENGPAVVAIGVP